MIRFLLCVALLPPFLPEQHTVSTRCPVDDPWFWALQQEDGSWDADSFPEEMEGAVPGRPEDDLAVTSLLVLAFLGDGCTSSTGYGSDRVARALGWLVAQQTESGRIGRTEHGRALHHHALATLALSENVFFKGKPDYSAQGKKAVTFLAGAALAGGGWSASGKAEDPVDPVTTTWAAMALRSASDAKLGESKELIEEAASWFRRRCDAESGLFRASGEAEPDYKATLCALATRSFAGEKPGASSDFGAALDAVIESRPEFRADPEYYYLATVVAYQTGGKRWKVWNTLMKQSVLELQRGGADTLRGQAPVNPDAPVCGSLGATAFLYLCLEFYFRYAKLVGAR